MRAGRPASPERDLWRLPADKAGRFASEELADWWAFVQPRLTVGDYVRRHAAEAREARMQAREAGESGDLAADDITTEGGITDDGSAEHDGPEGPGLADDDAGAFRRVPAAAEAPEAGSRAGSVRPGGRGCAGAANAGRAPAEMDGQGDLLSLLEE